MLPSHKNTNPYHIEGRWYRFFVESDGTAYTLTSSDIPDVELDGNFITLPVNCHVLDIKHDVHTVIGHAQTVTNRIRFNADATQSIPLPNPNVLDYAYIFAFCHFVE